jgi:hypothetical protein
LSICIPNASVPFFTCISTCSCDNLPELPSFLYKSSDSLANALFLACSFAVLPKLAIVLFELFSKLLTAFSLNVFN